MMSTDTAMEIRNAAVELYRKHREFWQAVAFEGYGGLNPDVIALLSVVEGDAVNAIKAAIVRAEDALEVAGVAVTRTSFEQPITGTIHDAPTAHA